VYIYGRRFYPDICGAAGNDVRAGQRRADDIARERMPATISSLLKIPVVQAMRTELATTSGSVAAFIMMRPAKRLT